MDQIEALSSVQGDFDTLGSVGEVRALAPAELSNIGGGLAFPFIQ